MRRMGARSRLLWAASHLQSLGDLSLLLIPWRRDLVRALVQTLLGPLLP